MQTQLPETLEYESPRPSELRVGTLSYTKVTLAVLFFWLLWGDVCFSLMENVIPSILPLKFQDLQASNKLMSLVLTIIPLVINMATNPVISFKSDRFRSRWGRRIPFIVVTMPILVLCLVGVGFGDSIGYWLRERLATALGPYSPQTVALITISVFMTVFSFVNMFVGSVFWYLFNDVVPEHLLARFMSWFRAVSVGAIFFYDLLIFRFAGQHAGAIFLGAAALYFFGFGAMCWNVREGKYPPAPEYDKGGTGVIAAVRTYAKECHSLAHYWFVFLMAIGTGGVIASNTFMVFFYQQTGLDLEQIGYVRSAGDVSMFVMILVSGWLADRFHPIRVVIAGLLLQIAVALPVSLVWLFWHPDPKVSYYLWLVVTICLLAPAGGLIGMLDPPLFMRIFPRSRYGQFGSANAIWRSISAIGGGLLLGILLDAVEIHFGKRTAYVCLPIWQFLSYGVMLAGALLLYRSWKHYGGDEGYDPPVRMGDKVVGDVEYMANVG